MTKLTRKELAEELEVSEREITIYKYDLEAAGVTITTVKGYKERKQILLKMMIKNVCSCI